MTAAFNAVTKVGSEGRPMIVLVTFTFGLVVWITAWALGVKSFDAFIFTAIITVDGRGRTMVRPFVEKFMKGQPSAPGER